MSVSYTTNVLHVSWLNVSWINFLYSHLFSRVFHADASCSVFACWRRKFYCLEENPTIDDNSSETLVQISRRRSLKI